MLSKALHEKMYAHRKTSFKDLFFNDRKIHSRVKWDSIRFNLRNRCNGVKCLELIEQTAIVYSSAITWFCRKHNPPP